MNIRLTIVTLFLASSLVKAQNESLFKSANNFLNLLDKNQKLQAQYPFDSAERFRWHYVPLNDRKGLSINEMNEQQKNAAMGLMKSSMSENTFKKASQIMALENVLKAIEKRADGDHFRDPGKYFFTVFGNPAKNSTWGWRLEGHHISFSFTSNNNKIVSGTPGFLGANPAVVLSGPEKGTEILKEENELSLEFLHALNEVQLKKAVISEVAPEDIVTVNSRKAMIDNPAGLAFSELTAAQKETFLKLLSLYIHRYTHLFADNMMHDIEAAGMDKLVFAWAGSQENGPGHLRYYRIKGPTIIIEFDNTQNNGNHVHTVVRDLKNDFGGDILLEHYKQNHS